MCGRASRCRGAPTRSTSRPRPRWRSTSAPGWETWWATRRRKAEMNNQARLRLLKDESVPWATGLTVTAIVAAITAVAIVVLSLGLVRVHPLLAVGLNIVAAGGLAPTLWGWRRTPVLRWFVLGAGVGVTGAWVALLALAAAGRA